MKARTKLFALIAGVGAFLAAFGWLLTTHGPLAPVGVQLGEVGRANLKPSVFGIGTVEARLAQAVGPLVPGRVLRVLVDQGEKVKVGQVLAEMDPIDLDHRVGAARRSGARSRQTLQLAEAQVADAASRAKLASVNRERDRRLHRQQVVSQQALDNSSSEAERAAAALAAAQANAEAARQDLGRVEDEAQGLRRLRASLRLVSPVDGVVVAREVEPGSTVVAGQAVLRLMVPASLWVRARIDQSRAGGVRVGQRASVVLRSAADHPLPARVARIELQSDPVTEERVIDLSFDAPPARLYLGELAEVTIWLPGEAGVLVLPSAAVARAGGQTGVWQLVDGRARFKPITLGGQGQADLTRLGSGLVEGERVIVFSSAALEPGVRARQQRVEPR
ncbi:MAG: efflux RND transporter periplasmic adaptor subunit [Proteobacteria bacterium]|nr:efflux RND transporter periplasmic adaptor subunit [Pseudomonadota bacterium]